jgi:hypothetical protein
MWRSARACFTGEMPIVTDEDGAAVRCDAVREGDYVVCCAEHDPTGPLVRKRVEAVFERLGRIWHIHVRERVIRTTAEHPFWVRDKQAWVAAGQLEVGDVFRSHDGQWVTCAAVYDTGAYEKVYNFRVADFHTYFVGGLEWGFSVWAHNQCTFDEFEREMTRRGYQPNSISYAWNKYRLSGEGGWDLVGFTKFLENKNYAQGRPRITDPTQLQEVIQFVTAPRLRPTLATPTLEAWHDGLGIPVGGPNPNGLRMRVVDGPTRGEGGVYLKPLEGRTKIGSTDDFYGRTMKEKGHYITEPIEVEIVRRRNGPAENDSRYPWDPRRQARFDEEYVDRLHSHDVKYRDPGDPKAAVSFADWVAYRGIFGYGSVSETFGYYSIGRNQYSPRLP